MPRLEGTVSTKKKQQPTYNVVVPATASRPARRVNPSRPTSVVSKAPYRISRVAVTPSRSETSTAWRPSYFKPNASLLGTLETMRSKLDDYSYSTFLGQILESRYSSYQDRMNQRYANQRDAYEHALDLASINAKAGKSVEVPEMPTVKGLKPGMGVEGLYKAMQDSLANTSDPKEIKNISRYYRYELERLQSIQNNQREQTNALSKRQQAFQDDMDLAIARGDVKKGQLKKPSTLSGLAAYGDTHGHRDHSKDRQMDIQSANPIYNKDNLIKASGDVHAQVADNPIDNTLKSIGGEAKDPLFWTLDKLSRPLYGTNEALKSYYSMDDDQPHGNAAVRMLSGGSLLGALSGKSMFDPVGEVISHPGKAAKEITKGLGRGFSGEDKTTFGQVIAANAQADDAKNIFDNHHYQAWAGLSGDLVADPLNYVGVGLVKKPLDVARGIKDVRETKKTAEAVSDVIRNSQHAVGPSGHLSDPDNVYKLLTGGENNLPKSAGARRQNIHEVNNNVDYLTGLIDSADINADTSRLASIEGVGKALAERRQALVDEFGDGVLAESLRSSLENSVQAGKATDADLAEFDRVLDSVHSDEIVGLLTPANEHRMYLNREAAKQFNVGERRGGTDITKAGHDTWVQTGADNLDQFEGVNRTGVTEGQDNGLMADVNASAERKTRMQKVEGHTENTGKYRSASEWEVAGEDPKNAEKMAEILANAPGKDLADALPSRLRDDPRLQDVDWDRIRRKSFAVMKQTPEGQRYIAVTKRLNGEIKELRKAAATARSKGNEKFASELERRMHGYMTRRDILVDRRDRIQSAAIIRLLKAHVAGKQGMRTFTNPDAARSLAAELDLVKARIKGHEDEAHITRMDNTDPESPTLAEHKADLERQLNSLEGVSGRGTKSLLGDAPEQFVKDGKLDTSELAKVIRFDAGQKLFRVKPGYPPNQWLTKYKNVLQENYERLFDQMRTTGPMRAMRDAEKAGNKRDWKKYNAAIAATSKKAQAAAIKQTEDAFEAGNLHEKVYSESLDIMLPKSSLEETLVKEAKSKQAAEIASVQDEKRVASMAGAQEEVKRLDAELGALRQKHAEERIAMEKAVKQARESKKVMSQRLKEEAVFRAASLAVAPKVTNAVVRIAGKDLKLPGSGLMFQKAEALNGLPLIKGTRQFFADAFQSPASQLSPEGQLIRARALAMTPNIIEHHINKLRHTLGNTREKDRNMTFVNMVDNGYAPKPGTDQNYDAIRAAFDDLIPFFRNEVVVGDSPITKSDINRYLPEEYRVPGNAQIGSMQDLVKAIRSNKGATKYDRKLYKDPYRLSWSMRVAVEQAQARRALEFTIGKAFGIKRGGIINPTTGKVARNSIQGKNKAYYDTVEKFKDLGWKTMPELKNTHYFPPEVIPDIKNLLHMMEPANVSRVGELVDKATHGWKTMTTIYNPGYWTRNGVGEIMSSWFAGVTDPRAYSRAQDIIKFARGDGQELEELTKHLPGTENFIRPASGEKVLFTTKRGQKVTARDMWLAYNHQGLKTGFVNTEFDSNFSKLGAAVRDNRGTQQVANFNDRLRGAGEWYEDYLRMAHFNDAVRRSPHDFNTAINHAAEEVRKYHFDYTDFTNFEKMTMLRIFPFYKWTRKAMPLMATMLFTKPGKVMAYPKIMNTISTSDISRDDNGFAPNYGDIVPGWIQDMWAYKIAEGSGNEDTYFNLATPQMDSYKSMVSPGSTGYGLLNPLIKVPVEQSQGFFGDSTLSGAMSKLDLTNNTNMKVDLNTNDPQETGLRVSEVMRQAPATNFLQKLGLGRGSLDQGDWQDFASFGTGLGFYKNDDDRRRGELMNRGMTKEQANAKLKDLYGAR